MWNRPLIPRVSIVQSSMREGSSPRFIPLSFCIPFSKKRNPLWLRIRLIKNGFPFTYFYKWPLFWINSYKSNSFREEPPCIGHYLWSVHREGDIYVIIWAVSILDNKNKLKQLKNLKRDTSNTKLPTQTHDKARPISLIAAAEGLIFWIHLKRKNPREGISKSSWYDSVLSLWAHLMRC